MRNAVKYIVERTWQPLLVKYLSKTRSYCYQDIQLEIPSTVFHPGFFFSSKLLLRQVKKLQLKEKNILELGAGSGLISIFAATRGAYVTATDINPDAIECIRKSSQANNVSLTTIESDLFKKLPVQMFDIIAINPPYYKKQPATYADYAWCCGEKGEYFQKLFAELKNYMHPATITLMILCDGCDINMVNAMAEQNDLIMKCIFTRQNFLEKNFIYQIRSERK
jgi:release factor glutamine methyltransferase